MCIWGEHFRFSTIYIGILELVEWQSRPTKLYLMGFIHGNPIDEEYMLTPVELVAKRRWGFLINLKNTFLLQNSKQHPCNKMRENISERTSQKWKNTIHRFRLFYDTIERDLVATMMYSPFIFS